MKKNQKSKIKDQKYIIKDRKHNINIFTIGITVWFLIFALCTLSLSKVRAQSLALSISPPLLEVMIKPGKSITQAYKISNEGETVVITPRIVELTQEGIKEDPAFSPESWITLFNTDVAWNKPFVLESKTQKQLLVKISPPIGAIEQNYYRAIILTTRPGVPGESSQTLISQTLASPLLISVTATGLIPREGVLTRFEVSKIMDSFDPLIIDIEIKNNGKTYFRPVGKVFLRGPVGRGTFEMIPNIIFTGQTRKIESEDFLTEKSSPHSLELPGFYLGKYEVEADFALDGETGKLKEKRVFYAVPWKGAVVVIGLLTGIKLLRSVKSLRKAKKYE